MELPRRRTGLHEPRSAIGNILAPVSGLQGSADVRTTPSARDGGVTAASRPPWATELDTSDKSQPQAQQQRQHPTSGRSSPSSRTQRAGGVAHRDAHALSFHTPAPNTQPVIASSPQASISQTDASGSPASWDNTPGLWPNTAPAMARPQSEGRAVPADQLDLWSQQQQHQKQCWRTEKVYAKVEHVDGPATAPVAGAAARRGGPAGSAPLAPPGCSSGSGNGPRLPPGDRSHSDRNIKPVPRSSAVPGRGAAGGSSAAAARVSASPARTTPSAECRTQGRSTSTPKPRPAMPPKRSTSITDNVNKDWVDPTTADRKSGAAANRATACSSGGGRGWDADPDGNDRGSWLFAVDGERPRSSSRDTDPDFRQDADRRHPSERPASAGHVADGCDSDAGGLGDANRRRTSPGRQDRHPPLARRPRAQSPMAGDLEATLSPHVAPVLSSAGGSSTVGMSLGHGPSAGMQGSGSSAMTVTAGRSSARHGGSSASQAEVSRHMQELQDENARLRDKVQHLERLFVAATPVAPATEAGHGRRGLATAAVARPSSASCMEGGPSIAAAAAGGIVLQQYKSQVIQLQRQVALMSTEIEGKGRLAFEAEGALLEMASRLAELAAGTGKGAAGAAGREAAPASNPGAAAEAAAGFGPVASGNEALSRDGLMQLHKWSKQMLGRLRSEKSESSKLFTQQAYEGRGTRRSGHGATSWADQGSGGAGTDGGSFNLNWVVPFLPAGGNRFLISGGGATGARGEAVADDLAGAAGGGGGGGGPSVAAIATGHAVLMADPLLAHRLELQLAALAPKLAALAVLLKTQLLPAMPWLGLEAADRLQAEAGEAAESVAQSAEALVQLCSLLPAGAAVFGEGPVAQEPKRRAAEVDAGRDSWLYGSPELLEAPKLPAPAINDDGVISVPRLQAAIVPLLRDRKTGSKALTDILEAVRSKSQSVGAKRAVLETELRFAARASALHAEHVSHLMLSVGMALEECRSAKDAAMIKSYFNAAAAVRQFLEAADALEIHPCETCLKALVDVIRVHRETLARVPELLFNAPAADVEGRLLGKVEELHQGFKKAISRLEAYKRRHADLLNRGSAGAAGDEQDADTDYENDVADHDEGIRGDSAAGDVADKVVRSAGGGDSRQQQEHVPAAKPPRPEWQD